MTNNNNAEHQEPFCETERLLALNMCGQNAHIAMATLLAIANKLSVLQAKYGVRADLPATQPAHPLLHKTK